MKRSGIVNSESANFTLPNSPQDESTKEDELLSQILEKALLEKKVDIEADDNNEWQLKSKSDDNLETIFKDLNIQHWFNARYQHSKNSGPQRQQLIEKHQVKESGFSGHYVYVLHILIASGGINVIKPTHEKNDWQFNVCEATTGANDKAFLKTIKSDEFSQWFSNKYNHPISIIKQKNRSELSIAMQTVEAQKNKIVGKLIVRQPSLEQVKASLLQDKALLSDDKTKNPLAPVKKASRRLSRFMLGADK